MMSNTPRTETFLTSIRRPVDCVVEFMRQLERELAAMTKRADEMERLKEHNAQLFYRIERELSDLKAQHAWRPIDTAPKDGTECECINWASENLTAQLLTGHHARCPHGGDQLTAALALISELAKGIELWAAEEDGVYDGVWQAYRKAKALQGVFLSDDPDKATEQPNNERAK